MDVALLRSALIELQNAINSTLVNLNNGNQTIFDNPAAKKYDRDGNKLSQTTLIFGVPIIENCQLSVTNSGCVLVNAGNSIIWLDNRFPLFPGQSISPGVQKDSGIFEKDFEIRFEPDPAQPAQQQNMLCYAEYKYHGIDQAFYKSKGKLG